MNDFITLPVTFHSAARLTVNRHHIETVTTLIREGSGAGQAVVGIKSRFRELPWMSAEMTIAEATRVHTLVLELLNQ